MTRLSVSGKTHRRLMRSDRILLKASVRLWVPKRWRYSVSEDQGGEEPLLLASPLPSDPLLQVLGCRLLHSEPPVREGFRFVPN